MGVLLLREYKEVSESSSSSWRGHLKLQSCRAEELLQFLLLKLLLVMAAASNKEYAEFEEKVKRTVYLDNLGPQVTASVLKTALGQFGNVISAQLIPIYVDSPDGQQFALVEMESPKKAMDVIGEMAAFPFMMSGMPRPVRARPAEPEMFSDRPARPGSKIQFRWLEPTDPEFEVAQKLKELTKQHAEEASALLRYQLEEEEKLEKKQDELVKTNHKKFMLLNSVMNDATVSKLTRQYKVDVTDV
ncbi:hypothetical protein H6P81_016098 [Aristolochia fimbriata]|uniref:RRM domain-containing protein n=1 Tax=Aristolochia fimbriata TaxID=158543 RepID=A0AAV7E7F1_ARIFI|nr:hypothetical protein H6P81_016098 [Aristolochia fimbriata]